MTKQKWKTRYNSQIFSSLDSFQTGITNKLYFETSKYMAFL